MKLQSVRVVSLSALMLISPLLTFAAGQPKLHPFSKSDMQKPVDVPKAVQWGKGTGRWRNQPVTPEHNLHLRTAVESLTRGAQRANASPNWGDSAFRK
jgi:hypothetical protein